MLFKHVNQILEHSEESRESFKTNTIVSQVAWLVVLLAAFTNMQIVTAVAPPEQVWIDNIYTVCGKVVESDHMALKSLADSGQFSLFFGAYLALILRGRYSSYFVIVPEEWTFAKYVLRMAIDGTIFWALYSFWQFGGLFGIDPENEYVTWIFIDTIPSFLAGLALFSIDYLWVKAGVLGNDPSLAVLDKELLNPLINEDKVSNEVV
mmetsp:Transcript_64152/g.88739  ORF Transcript_64152/g.88739 Transcript_64152/m.88739 type:complete len:207 (-) Transcript_64152:87-707(-)